MPQSYYMSTYALRSSVEYLDPALNGGPNSTSALVPSGIQYLSVFNNGVNHGRSRDIFGPLNYEKGDILFPTGFERIEQLRPLYDGDTYSRYSSTEGPLNSGYTPVGFYQKLIEDNTVPERAIGKIYDQLRGNIDLSIDLYQSSKTIHLIKEISELVALVARYPKKALRKSYRAWNASKGHRVRRGTKKAGSLWLEYSYGIGSTARTIHDTLELLASNIEPLMRIKARASDAGERRYEYDPNVITHEVELVKYSYRRYYIVDYQHTTGTLDLLSQLTSLNPASFLWENQPFSFVADWAFNVGGCLRSLESSILYASDFKRGCLVASWLIDTAKFSVQRNDDSSFTRLVQTNGHARYKSYNRVVLTSTPVPPLPHFKVKLGSGRLLNAAALLTNLLARK